MRSTSHSSKQQNLHCDAKERGMMYPLSIGDLVQKTGPKDSPLYDDIRKGAFGGIGEPKDGAHRDENEKESYPMRIMNATLAFSV